MNEFIVIAYKGNTIDGQGNSRTWWNRLPTTANREAELWSETEQVKFVRV